MNKIIRVSNLSRLFGIEQESWDDYPYPNDGYFDAQLNYHFGDEYFPSILFPWEWVLFPEVVERAKQLAIFCKSMSKKDHHSANPDNEQALYGRNAPYRACYFLFLIRIPANKDPSFPS